MKIQRSVSEQRKLDRDGKCERARVSYIVSEVDLNALDRVLKEVYDTAPESWESVPKDSVEIIRSPGGGIVEIAVNYRKRSTTSCGRSSRRWKHSGDRVWRVEVNANRDWTKYSLGCLKSVKVDSGAPTLSPGNLIDWNGLHGSASESGRVPVYTPDMNLHCIATFRKSKAESRTYLRLISGLVGKVNSETFHNWHAGEVLFLGMIKSEPFEGRNGEELCDLTFRFSIRPGGERRAAGVNIGHVDGWDHLWMLPSPSGSGIHSVHVSKLYERASFAALDL